MQELNNWLAVAKQLMSSPLFSLGGSPLTLGTLFYLAAALLLLMLIAARLSRWLAGSALTRTRLDAGARQSIATITHYVVLFLGTVVILQTAGIDLTTLNVLAGAVGVGIGFGLQPVVSNFICGLILMFERPIKIGDRVVVDHIDGAVTQIGARSTKILTNDNITIIVPNSKFITENVTNWQFNDATVRFRIPVSVAYGTDARLVEKLLLEVAATEAEVLNSPAPGVRLLAFGDNGLEFELRAWSSSLVHRKGLLTSTLNFAIYDKFREHAIEIPFPQRDLRLRSGMLNVRLDKDPA